MTTTYILGAGASVHAGYPLASGLGEELYKWARASMVPGVDAWLGYLESLRDTFGTFVDFEDILTHLVECAPNSPADKLSRMTRGNTLGAVQVLIPEFFHAISVERTGIDLYSDLASRCYGGDTVITFNYDLACERAFKAARLWEVNDGYGFDAGMIGIPASRTKILKLHGSVNWMGLLFGGNMGFGQAASVYGYRPAVFGARNFSFLGYDQNLRDELCKGVSRSGGQPALILPVRNKSFFHPTFAGEEWGSFWDYLWGTARNSLRSAERVVMIGYSMPRADERARELLLGCTNKGAQISIFSGSGSVAIEREFKACGFRNVARSEGKSHFVDFLANRNDN